MQEKSKSNMFYYFLKDVTRHLHMEEYIVPYAREI